MAEVINPVIPNRADDDKYVYFHSGSKVTYRKIAEKPTSFTSIPTIDIADIDSESLEVRKQIASRIYDACHNVGFFYVKNHGIPKHIVDSTFEILKRFFSLDLETKLDAHVQKNPAIRGYEPMLETRLDPRTKGDIKEAFTMGDCVMEPEQDYTGKTGLPPPPNITKPQNIWPRNAPFWREGLYQYYNQVLPLAMKLVRIFALAFHLPETEFDQMFKFPITGMRALYYPPTPADGDSHNVGLGAHSDFSWITLVLQDAVPALEVLNQDGVWIDAPPQPNTLVCNVGQYLERQTNGKFPATVHRVRNKTGLERYSLPFFLTMDPDVDLGVMDCCIEDGEEPKFEKINVGDLYIRRVLPARDKHPTSIRYKDVPQDQWKYDLLLS
ncbi:2og-Fe oxygenase family protein [Pseudomassariella vexata]|uniref:2og-Fe oxygenase family protein n=1 Tax=Pseudomassariella vexata TaxID=1141098 RepID=A0A1Y2EAJ3_9PEZI|nr:2og-Fe oxygenase family protein [Pseudomassariella vexata]ORY68562.1 2og-Fe oxygenase family protein [Pseudomassariella vexata]